MPRTPSTSKRHQGAANVRDTRHDNGLVGPGKRVQRQKSNGHINGHANASDAIPSTPSPATPPPTNGHARVPGHADNTSEHKMAGDLVRRTSVSGHSDCSSDAYNVPTVVFPQEHHRHINVNSAKNPSVHRDSGPWHYVRTVLTSCPISDTIAILIVLLQIPPTFLSIIQLLFATLTFVPPSITANSALSFTDIFEGTLGTPSLATIMVVDVFFLSIWLFLWSPLQDFVLQFAQSVIALTLGGGISGKEAGMKNVFLCFGYISLSHYYQNGNIKSAGLRAVLSSPRGLLGTSDSDDPLEPISSHSTRKGPQGWIKSVLAIHILTQGVVRYIRDWYVRREKRDHSSSNIGDPEAAKGSADGNNDSSTTSSQAHDTESTSSLHANHTAITSRKRRKQSAQVRIQQPLWAALASTKIVMVKEYETSHAAAESAGTNATDASNLGNAPFSTEADRVWITHVGSDEVSFSTSHFPNHNIPEDDQEGRKDSETGGVDKRCPFYVKVNQTHWQPTKVKAIVDPSLPAGQNICWSGEIFGLAPLNNYECEFVSTVDNTVIFSTSVRTLPPSDTATAATLTPLPPQVSGRPGSPSTTIKASIASSEAKLVEERNRQKRERKEQRTKLTAIRKDIERLNSSIASSGGNDDRLRQKVQQVKLHMKQAEDAIETLTNEIEAVDKLPSISNDSSYMSAKAAYRKQKELHEKAKSEFNQFKASAEQSIASLTAELTTIVGKCERMQARSTKLSEQQERIAEANAKGLDEQQRRERERAAKEEDRRRKETSLIEQENNYQNLNAVLNEQLLQLCHMMEKARETMQQEVIASSAPWTTEASMSGFPAYAPIPAMQSNFINSSMLGAMGSTPRRRGRSSSMLSNESGFTQGSDDDNTNPYYGPQNQILSQPLQQYISAPYNQSSSSFAPAFRPPPQQSYSDPNTASAMMYQPQPPRKGSSGSGGSGSASHLPTLSNPYPAQSSGSGSSRGSIGDPKSPAPGHALLPSNGFGAIGSGIGTARSGLGHANAGGNMRAFWDN
ncbi:ubiquitination network signaling protein [Rutstroemia sp. NJR-2017a WRK4]|nr:ubiquitination network signaling protein [Rutstroemia sp. NJR-2017a WRK4]